MSGIENPASNPVTKNFILFLKAEYKNATKMRKSEITIIAIIVYIVVILR